MKIKNNGVHNFIGIFFLLLPSYATAQDNFFGNSGEKFTPYTIIIILLAIIFTLTAFLSIFLRQFSQGCFGLSIVPGNPNVTADGVPVARGLDAEVIKALPTYFYSDVKEHRKGKVVLECAVCLSEFLDAQALRLLPGCSHVFHPKCIDQWLLSHVTCPICRRNLETGSGEAKEQEHEHAINLSFREDQSFRHDDDGDDEDEENKERKRRNNFEGKFPRSHSTGHSLADSERFMLRLSEEVNNTLVNRSCYAGDSLTSILSPRSAHKSGTRSGPVRSLTSTGVVDGGSKKKMACPPAKTSECLWPI